MDSIVEFTEYKDLEKYSRFNIDNNTKDELYYLNNLKSFYSLYLNDLCMIPFSYGSTLDELRAYGLGNQNPNKYKDTLYQSSFKSDETNQIFERGNAEVLRKGLNQLMDDIVSYFPKIRTIIHGMIEKTDFDIFVDCVDWKSVDKKRQKKWELWNKKVNAEFLKEFADKAGLPVDEVQFLPSSIEELNEYEASGNFRLNEAKAIEKVINEHWAHSKWDYYLKKKIIDDLIDFSIAFTKSYYDTKECRFKQKYINPRHYIGQYSESFEFDDSSFWGHYEVVKIGDLIAKGLDKNKLVEVAKCYNGKFGNPFYNDSRWENLKLSENTDKFYYNFAVQVMECEWIDIDNYKLSTIQDLRRSKTKIYKSNFDKPIKNKKVVKHQIEDIDIQYLYKGTWVINSDLVYDYGKANFIDRPTLSSIKSNYSCIMLTGRSLTSMLKPVLDLLQMSWLKLLDSLAKAFDGGYAVNVTMLENVYNGKNKLDPTALLKLFKKEKFLLFKHSLAGNYKGGASTPLTPVPSTLGTEIQQYLTTISITLDMVEKMTGFNPVSLGGSPMQNQAVGTTEASLAGVSNMLKPLISSVFKLKANASESVARRVPMAMQFNDKIFESYKKIIGESEALLLRDGAINDIAYSFEFKERQRDALAQRLLAYVQSALELGRNGARGGIELDVAMKIESMIIKGSNLEDIRLVLSYEIRKYNEKLDFIAQRNMKFNQDSQMQIKQMDLEIENRKANTKFQTEAALTKMNNDSELQKLIFENNKNLTNYMIKKASEDELQPAY